MTSYSRAQKPRSPLFRPVTYIGTHAERRENEGEREKQREQNDNNEEDSPRVRLAADPRGPWSWAWRWDCSADPGRMTPRVSRTWRLSPGGLCPRSARRWRGMPRRAGASAVAGTSSLVACRDTLKNTWFNYDRVPVYVEVVGGSGRIVPSPRACYPLYLRRCQQFLCEEFTDSSQSHYTRACWYRLSKQGLKVPSNTFPNWYHIQ